MKTMKRSSILLTVLLASLAGLASTGCETVHAYQRGKLAHPTMAVEDQVGAAEAHVYGIQEGAEGGSGGTGAGCGCN